MVLVLGGCAMPADVACSLLSCFSTPCEGGWSAGPAFLSYGILNTMRTLVSPPLFFINTAPTAESLVGCQESLTVSK